MIQERHPAFDGEGHGVPVIVMHEVWNGEAREHLRGVVVERITPAVDLEPRERDLIPQRLRCEHAEALHVPTTQAVAYAEREGVCDGGRDDTSGSDVG